MNVRFRTAVSLFHLLACLSAINASMKALKAQGALPAQAPAAS